VGKYLRRGAERLVERFHRPLGQFSNVRLKGENMLVLEIDPEKFENIVRRVVTKHQLWTVSLSSVQEIIMNTTYDIRVDVGEDKPHIQRNIYQVIGEIHSAIKYLDSEGITSANILEELYNELLLYVHDNPML